MEDGVQKANHYSPVFRLLPIKTPRELWPPPPKIPLHLKLCPKKWRVWSQPDLFGPGAHMHLQWWLINTACTQRIKNFSTFQTFHELCNNRLLCTLNFSEIAKCSSKKQWQKPLLHLKYEWPRHEERHHPMWSPGTATPVLVNERTVIICMEIETI